MKVTREKLFGLGCIIAGFCLMIGMPLLVDLYKSFLALLSLGIGSGCLIFFGTLVMRDPWS
ncbi:hypothetical protein MUP59_00850 [Candidatus Bathyarchaeota archaeon]|nr:hypothetical protein [Candidatus Bathyarchaeota archaeon]